MLAAPADFMCEHDDLASDDGSVTLAPTSATGSGLGEADLGQLEDLGDFLEPAQAAESFALAVLDHPVEPAAPVLAEAVVVCPKLLEVLSSAGLEVPEGWSSLVDAVNMPAAFFGRATERVRRTCMSFFAAQLAARLPELGPAPPAGGGGRRENAVSRAGSSAPPDTPACVPSVGVGPGSSGLHISAALPDATCGVARRLLASIPEWLLFPGQSHAPHVERIRNRVDSLSSYDVGSLRKAALTAESWGAFCSRHAIADWGYPFDTDTILWFLREEDASARCRAGFRDAAGRSVKHARADGLRLLHRALGLGFEQACLPQVRVASAARRDVEPAFTAMWNVGVVRLVLLIAVRYRGHRAELIRCYAAGAYMLCLASLRQIDGVRSPPPKLGSLVVERGGGCVPVFSSVASATKARRKSRMQPMPWDVPACSVDPSISDEEAAAGLAEAFAFVPSRFHTMFPSLVDLQGKPANLAGAVAFSAAEPSVPISEARLATSLAYLLTFRPVALPPPEARVVARRKHGPRHVFPELGRCMGLPAPLRDELGRWKEAGGRLRRMANRYSREAERLLQVRVRLRVARWIQTRAVNPLTLQPLADFAAADTAVVELAGFGQQLLLEAGS